MRALQIGVSGLRVEADTIGVVGDNIANVNTPGFKRQRAAFEDVFNRGSGGAASGSGVRLGSVEQAFTQGALLQTGLGTDVALNGDGFFLVSGSVNGLTGTFYSRAGQFHLDPNGKLVDPSGLQVMGKTVTADGEFTATVKPLAVPTNAIPAAPTSALTVTANLDASDPVPATAAFDILDPSGTSTLATSIEVFDSLGAPHALEVYFDKTGDGQWQYHAVVRGDEVDPAQPGVDVEVGTGSLSFTSDGALDVFSPDVPISVNFAQATPGQLIDIDFGTPIADGGTGLDGATQFSMASGVSSQAQNGFSSGSLTGISIVPDGTVLGLYTNGRSVPVGQIQIAKFRATESLARAGNNLWMETSESGSAAVSAPGTGGGGLLTSGALESSNVDLGEEMVTMILHQRAFSASSKVIAAADDLLSELMQLKR